MGTALVVSKAQLPRRRARDENLLAAQYVRMSTDRQQYSIPNQMAAIALYAAERNLTIVRTYMDEATSGLKLKNRHGLIELLNDIQSGKVEYGTVLVFDVSRWGRFQDTDESAYYEFLCKQARIKVVYCAEVFENDGSPMSGIFKNLKRVMAAEFSRDLSEKVFAGQSRVSRMGFWVGGQPGFALRRELVDAKGNSKGLLEPGQHKWLHTDRVILRTGRPEEIATVRWIFEAFVQSRINETDIARQLNARGIAHHRGTTWNNQMIGRILRDEAYVGNTLYNRTSNKLRRQRVANPKAKWVRGEKAHEPIIPRNLFDEAQRILEQRLQKLSSGDLLKKLRILLRRRGYLSRTLIDRTKDVPKAHIYDRRFGRLRAAYDLIGYTPKIDCSHWDGRVERMNLIKEVADQIVASVPKINSDLIAERAGGYLKLDGNFFLSLRVSRCWQHSQRHCPIWTLWRGARPRPGLFVIVRMDEQNEQPADYILASMTSLPNRRQMLTEEALFKRRWRRFETRAAVILALKRRLSPKLKDARNLQTTAH